MSYHEVCTNLYLRVYEALGISLIFIPINPLVDETRSLFAIITTIMYSQDENSPQSVEALVDLHDDDGSVAANNDDEPAAAAVPFEQASKEVVAVPSSVPASVLDTAGRNSMNTSFAALQVRVYGLKD